MKKALVLFCLLLFTTILVGCRDTSSHAVISSAGGMSTIDQLPKATSPVTTGSGISSSMSAATNSISYVASGLASTGLNLRNADNNSFSSGDSRSMCEMTNITKELLSRAASVDQTLCYIQNTMTSSANESFVSGAGIDIYDGQYHTFKLDFSNSSGQGPNIDYPVVRFKIVRSGNQITEFEMFGCFGDNSINDGNTDGNADQTEYLRQVISGSNITISSKNMDSWSQGNDSGTWRGQMNLSGTLSASGQFTSKSIVARSLNSYSSGGSSGSHSSKGSLAQGTNYITFSGFNTGTHGSNTYTNRVYSKFQLIDNNTSVDNYTLSNLYIGDGSLKVVSNYNDGSDHPWEETESWNGDTLLNITAADGDFYSVVNAASVPGTESISITFSASEQFNCNSAGAPVMEVDMTTLQSACSAYTLTGDGGDSWINCYSITE